MSQASGIDHDSNDGISLYKELLENPQISYDELLKKNILWKKYIDHQVRHAIRTQKEKLRKHFSGKG